MFERGTGRRKARGAVRRSQTEAVSRSSLRVMARVLLFGALAAGGWYAGHHYERPVMLFEHVRIDGEFINLSPSQVQETIRSNLHGDYFTLDLDVIRNALLELPWVREVSVRRRWPSGLDVTIDEKRAIALWGDGSLLSERGDVFTPPARGDFPDLPSLTGPLGQHAAVWRFYVDMRDRLDRTGMAVASIVLDDRRSWRVVLDDGLQIRLGRTDVGSRLKRLYQVFAMRNEIGLETMRQIDMRYPNGFAAMHRQDNGDNDASLADYPARLAYDNDDREDNAETGANEA